MMNRNEMVQALQNGLSEVTFIKVNGDVRDVNADGWRSFRVENVTNFDNQ